MSSTDAARLAVELLAMPSRARQLRAGPLPDGTEVLLRIAAGDQETLDATALRIERTPRELADAAAFFIEQILFDPQSDSYRVFGLSSTATPQALRHNMALILRWLHPDRADRAETRSVYVSRVTQAWEDIKTADRRQRYDVVRGAGHPFSSSMNDLQRPGRGSKAGRKSKAASAKGSSFALVPQSPQPLLKRGLFRLFEVFRTGRFLR